MKGGKEGCGAANMVVDQQVISSDLAKEDACVPLSIYKEHRAM